MLKKHIFLGLLIFQVLLVADVEEVVVTGSLINNLENDSSPIEVINKEDLENLNITQLAEISKYLNISSGSRFQTNALEGTDQGMTSITLRGLDHASTLLLINSNRHTFAGTTSDDGEAYIDANIVPEIAIERIEILKEGATSLYGSDAIAGVINFITIREFEGMRFKVGSQKASNYNHNDKSLGILFGKNINRSNIVAGINILERSPLSAREIPGIAELGLSTFGKTFKLLAPDEVTFGDYAGVYPNETTFVPDPKCEANGGVLDGSFCRFLYGERFNIVNDESHKKAYLNFSRVSNKANINISLLASNVKVNDNPQSPSYPALPFLSRNILPGEGGSPFNVPLKWYGRPLGSEYDSPHSPKDIFQHHLTAKIGFKVNVATSAELTLSSSRHQNDHFRPDIIDSRFLDAIQGKGGPNGDEMWNIFDSSQNSQELIDYVSGAEVSKKTAHLDSLNLTFTSAWNQLRYAYGIQYNQESLDVIFDEISRADFDNDGKLLKIADLFFLGGGTNVDSQRTSKALFTEMDTNLTEKVNLRLAARYESMNNENSLDPKLSLKYNFSDSLSFRFSQSTGFSMPSMAQMYSSFIKLGSVRDVTSSVFVRQAVIGNPDLKPATSKNKNLGLIYEISSFKLSTDFWEVKYKNRVEAENAQALLTADPNGPSITRNELGDLVGVTTSYFNEESTLIRGYDIQMSYTADIDFIEDLTFVLKGTKISKFMTPQEIDGGSVLVNRVGKFNYDAHTHSLPAKRINGFITWKSNDYFSGLTVRYIDGYKNERPISSLGLTYGYTNTIKSSLLFDFSIGRHFALSTGALTSKLAIVNLFDKKAPRLFDAPDFSFDTRVHDPRGRLLHLIIEYNF